MPDSSPIEFKSGDHVSLNGGPLKVTGVVMEVINEGEGKPGVKIKEDRGGLEGWHPQSAVKKEEG